MSGPQLLFINKMFSKMSRQATWKWLRFAIRSTCSPTPSINDFICYFRNLSSTMISTDPSLRIKMSVENVIDKTTTSSPWNFRFAGQKRWRWCRSSHNKRARQCSTGIKFKMRSLPHYLMVIRRANNEFATSAQITKGSFKMLAYWAFLRPSVWKPCSSRG